jgi:magnesium transporter
MVYDCPSACSTPADNIPPLSFCASRNNFRSCPGSTTFSNLDNLARWDAIDNVTSILKKSLPSYSGEFVYNVTGTTCGDTIAAVSCAVNIPVCEAGSHTRKLCNASMCDTLSTSCYNLLDRTQIQALCNHFSPRVEHTITNNPDGCFNLDYEGPSYVQWVIGFMLCVVFAAMSSLALNLQKSSLNEADKKDIPTPLCRQPKWVLGMVILVTGSIVDFIAYGLAPQSVLTPLGGMVLVWNVVISTCFFGERAGKREWTSTFIIFLGKHLLSESAYAKLYLLIASHPYLLQS